MKNFHFIRHLGVNAFALMLCTLLASCTGGGGGTGGTTVTIPAISSTSPANNAAQIGTNSVITATFNEAMDLTTITASTFTLNNGVTGTVTYTGTTATFTPTTSLAPSKTYTATISNGVKDTYGNSMPANYTWTFTTGTQANTNPTMASTSPVNNATGVAVNATINVTFN